MKAKSSVFSMVFICCCFLLAGMVDSPAEQDIAQLSREQRLEISSRSRLQEELLAATELDLEKAAKRYVGTASRNQPHHRRDVAEVKRQLLEQELVEASR